jgi:Nucleoside 2-deoxyribosyltransferase like
MPIEVIEAPTEFHKPAIFLAGTISGAHDWQSRFIRVLETYKVDMIALNPRRESFDLSDASMTDRQIHWEYRHLRRADLILFYFSHETMAPITLLELGAHTHSSGKPIFVGVHPDYARSRDVEVQCRLIRPDIKIVHRLEELADQVHEWYVDFMRNVG